MDLQQAQLICNALHLGTVQGEPHKVTGGLLHRMWKLSTDKGQFACKQLSKNIQLTPATRMTYELTEHIAQQFHDLGIPALSALITQGTHLIDARGDTFLVYPWSNAITLTPGTVHAAYALKIAQILAHIHAINLSVPEFTSSVLHVYQPQTLTYLIERCQTRTLPFAQTLKEHQGLLLSIVHACQSQLPQEQSDTIVSHGDLDQKNVLWDTQGNPTIIDWEAARKLNPTKEIIDAALNWSGITTKSFDQAVYAAMIQAYSIAGGTIDQHGIHQALLGILNNWIHWLVHNIEGSLSSDHSSAHQPSAEEHALHIEQIETVLKTITQLWHNMPNLIALTQQTLQTK